MSVLRTHRNERGQLSYQCKRCKFELEHVPGANDQSGICWPCIQEFLRASKGAGKWDRLPIASITVEPHAETTTTTLPILRPFRAELLWVPPQIGGLMVRQIGAGDGLALLVNKLGIPVELLSPELCPSFPAILWPTLKAGEAFTFELIGDDQRRSFGGAFLGRFA